MKVHHSLYGIFWNVKFTGIRYNPYVEQAGELHSFISPLLKITQKYHLFWVLQLASCVTSGTMCSPSPLPTAHQ